MGLELALRGLRLAIDAIDPNVPDVAEVRTSEAVVWAAVAAELTDPAIRHRLSPAVAMTRNAVLHGAAVCMNARDGLVWPLVWPLRWTDAVWAPMSVIRASLRDEPAAAKVRDYDEYMAGQRVLPTLQSLLDYYSAAAPRSHS